MICYVVKRFFYSKLFTKMDYEKQESDRIRNKQSELSGNIAINNFIDKICKFLTAIFRFIGFAYIITLLEPIVLAFIIGIIFLNRTINERIAKNHRKHQPALARFARIFDYLFSVMSSYNYAKELRINQANGILSKKFNETLNGFHKQHKKLLGKQLLFNILLSVVSFVQTLVSYGYVAFCAIIGKITVGEFNLYIGAIYNLSGSLNEIISQLVNYKYFSKYVDEYKCFMNEIKPKNLELEVNNLPLENDEFPMFEFKNVHFTYPNTEIEVLKDISIKINKGERLSIVGFNGAGKTTFIKLLCRLYTPTKGTITYYGVDISTIKRAEYLEILSVVFQDFKIFSFSFLDNIILNKPLDEKRLERAIEYAGLSERVKTLPHGVYTNLHKDFDEEGIELSGGEGQKLAMARAYYKDADLVILDEPTAALDPIAEYEIYQKYNRIAENKTSIFISHRLASTRFCDNIAVFAEGRIAEYGGHDELIQKDGLYAEMFNKQACYYTDTLKEKNQ